MDHTKAPDEQPGPGAGVTYLHALFDRHKIPPHAQTGVIRTLFGLEWQAAMRRRDGIKPLTFDDLAIVAAHYNETLSDALHHKLDAEGMTATLTLGGARFECQVWFSESPPKTSDLVATQDAGLLKIVLYQPGVSGRTVHRLVINRVERNQHQIAVLDDNADLTDTLCEHLTADGFVATGYTRINALRQGMSQRQLAFDGYVLDWKVDEPIAALLSEIRALTPDAPIIILSGQIDAHVLVDAMSQWGVDFFQKADEKTFSFVSTKLKRLLSV